LLEFLANVGGRDTTYGRLLQIEANCWKRLPIPTSFTNI